MDRKNTTPQGTFTSIIRPLISSSYITSFPNLFPGETALVLVEFLEVAITCIVFLKSFYPSGTLSFLSLASLYLSFLFCGRSIASSAKKKGPLRGEDT